MKIERIRIQKFRSIDDVSVRTGQVLAVVGQNNAGKSQFIMTTHSTVIIDRLGHEAIALCRKVKGNTRDIVTTVSQTCEDFWGKYRMQEERYCYAVCY